MLMSIALTKDDIKLIENEVYSTYGLTEGDRFLFDIVNIELIGNYEFIFTIQRYDNSIKCKVIIPLEKFNIHAVVGKNELMAHAISVDNNNI